MFPLYIDTPTQLIKYWLRLRTLQNDRIVKKVYDTAVEQELDWIIHVQDILCRNGFQSVWLNPAVDAKHFGNIFKERLKDAFLPGWRQEVNSCNKLKTYSQIKSQFILKNYLSSVRNKAFAVNITVTR